MLVLNDDNDCLTGEIMPRSDRSLYLNGTLFLKRNVKISNNDVGCLQSNHDLTSNFPSNAIQMFPSGHRSIIGLTTTPTMIQIHIIRYNETSSQMGCHYQKANSTAHFLYPDVRMKTSNEHYVTWGRDGLLKELIDHQDLSSVMSHISNVYQQELPHFEWGIVAGKNKLLITRVGIRISIAIYNKFISTESIIKDINLALEELHTIGLAHCDVFIKNVFYDEVNHCAILSNLEYYTPLHDPPPNTKKFGQELRTAIELDLIKFEKVERVISSLVTNMKCLNCIITVLLSFLASYNYFLALRCSLSLWSVSLLSCIRGLLRHLCAFGDTAVTVLSLSLAFSPRPSLPI
eukprot:gene777-1493_t